MGRDGIYSRKEKLLELNYWQIKQKETIRMRKEKVIIILGEDVGLENISVLMEKAARFFYGEESSEGYITHGWRSKGS